MKLASGIAGVEAWIAKGALAGLGTDGAASSNDLDMFEAMRMAALLHKVATMDPRVMPARQALEMATRGGAAALGLGDRTGSLEQANRQTSSRWRWTARGRRRCSTPMSHLVYVTHGDDVRTTIVAGRVLMRDRQILTLQADEVMRDGRAMAERVRPDRCCSVPRARTMPPDVLIDEQTIGRAGQRDRRDHPT